MEKLSIVGIIGGFVLGVVTFIRYYFIYPDIDKLLFYGLTCLNFIISFYIYNMLSESNKAIAKSDLRLTIAEEHLSDLDNLRREQDGKE